MIKKIFSFTFILTLLIFSCSSDSDDSSSEVWEQKSVMLTNWADNFISPSYTTLTNNLILLEESGNTFANSTNQQNLDNLRTSFINAYMSWQYVEMFDIGLAEENYYKSKMNIYPTTVSRIELNIQNGLILTIAIITQHKVFLRLITYCMELILVMNLFFQNIILNLNIYPIYHRLSTKCFKILLLLLKIGKVIETPLLVRLKIPLHLV